MASVGGHDVSCPYANGDFARSLIIGWDGMINNKIDDAVFDEILRQAFADSREAELKEYEKSAAEYAGSSPTKKQQREARSAMRRAGRGRSGTVIIRRAAAAVLIVFSMASAVMMLDPAILAAVSDSVTGFYEKYVSFIFKSGWEEITLGAYTLGYVPDGYSLVDSYESNSYCEYILEKDGGILIFSYSYSGLSNINSDTENRTVKPLSVNGMNAYYLEFTDGSEPPVLVWGNESISFSITGNITEKEFVKIAKNIK